MSDKKTTLKNQIEKLEGDIKTLATEGKFSDIKTKIEELESLKAVEKDSTDLILWVKELVDPDLIRKIIAVKEGQAEIYTLAEVAEFRKGKSTTKKGASKPSNGVKGKIAEAVAKIVEEQKAKLNIPKGKTNYSAELRTRLHEACAALDIIFSKKDGAKQGKFVASPKFEAAFEAKTEAK